MSEFRKTIAFPIYILALLFGAIAFGLLALETIISGVNRTPEYEDENRRKFAKIKQRGHIYKHQR